MTENKEDAVVIGVKYPKDSRKAIMSQFLRPFRPDLSTMIIVPKSFVEQITMKITEAGGMFKVLKDEIKLVRESSPQTISAKQEDIIKIKNALHELYKLFEGLSNLLRSKNVTNDAQKVLSIKEYNDLLKSINVGMIDDGMKITER